MPILCRLPDVGRIVLAEPVREEGLELTLCTGLDVAPPATFVPLLDPMPKLSARSCRIDFVRRREAVSVFER